MRKLIVLNMIVVVILSSIVGCGKRYTESNDDKSGVTEKIYKTIDIKTGSVSDKEDNNPYVFSVGDDEYEAIYEGSEYDSYNNIIDIYSFKVDEGKIKKYVGGVEFEFYREDNSLKKIYVDNWYFPFWEQEILFDKEDDARVAADEIARKYINIDEYVMNNYVLNNRYYFEYTRYIDGLMTEERLIISLDSDEPESMSVNWNKLGKYKGATLGEFDIEEGEIVALEKAKETFGEVEYEVTKRVVSTVEGKLGVTYTCVEQNDDLGKLLLGGTIFVYLD